MSSDTVLGVQVKRINRIKRIKFLFVTLTLFFTNIYTIFIRKLQARIKCGLSAKQGVG